MEFGKSDVGSLLRDSSDVHGCGEFEIVLWAVIDNVPGLSSIDSHSKILLYRDELGHVGLSVRERLEAIHGRGRVIADIVGDAYPAVIELDGQVLTAVAVVKQYPVLLVSRKNNRHVCLGPCAKCLQLDQRVAIDEAQTRHVLTSLACKNSNKISIRVLPRKNYESMEKLRKSS